MSTTFPPDAPPVSLVGVVAGARELLTGLDEVLWAARTPADLLGVNVELERLRSQLAAVQAQVAVEIEATDAAKTEGWASVKDYLTDTAGARRGHGGRLLRTGRQLTGRLSATWTALHAGDLSPEHAEVIVKVIDRLPVDAEVRRRTETVLIAQAAHLNASDLQTAGDHVLEVVDPDGTARREETALDRLERSAHLNRCLSIVADGLGGVRVRGRGTVEDAAIIKTALAALAAPMSAALAGTDPDCGEEARDPRDHGARTWDALVEACQRLHDTDVLPESHGTKPRIILTLGYQDLKTGIGAVTLDTGDRLSVAAVRRLACDADLIPAVLGTRGEVLDLGRTHRLVTTVLWLALILRDRHCTFPGCRRPPVACDAHHLQHWADGGPTSLNNLALLCRAHHTILHTTGWQIRLNPTDQKPEFQPPPSRHRITPALRNQLGPTGQSGDSDDWVRERTPRT
ncbi:MAG: DUF222 domain-containing protein [Nocardioidaceae bacterium]|nr:DUF222 domain-containing protein [Nocardioidaceae bacterium]